MRGRQYIGCAFAQSDKLSAPLGSSTGPTWPAAYIQFRRSAAPMCRHRSLRLFSSDDQIAFFGQFPYLLTKAAVLFIRFPIMLFSVHICICVVFHTNLRRYPDKAIGKCCSLTSGKSRMPGRAYPGELVKLASATLPSGKCSCCMQGPTRMSGRGFFCSAIYIVLGFDGGSKPSIMA